MCLCVHLLPRLGYCHQMSVPGNVGKQWSLRGKRQLPGEGRQVYVSPTMSLISIFRSEWVLWVCSPRIKETLKWSFETCWKHAHGRVLWQEVRIEIERCSCGCISIGDLRNKAGCGCIMCCFDTVSKGKAENILEWRLYPEKRFPQRLHSSYQTKEKPDRNLDGRQISISDRKPSQSREPTQLVALGKVSTLTSMASHVNTRSTEVVPTKKKKNALSLSPTHFPWREPFVLSDIIWKVHQLN